MIHWDTAAVVIALVLPALPIARDLAIKAAKWAIPVVEAGTCRCLRLSWKDVPPGRIHECVSISCYHSHHHAEIKNCFESGTSIAGVFDRAWRHLGQQPVFVPKPESLPLWSDFICTDARTILAFVMCTVADRKSSSWHPHVLSYDTTSVDLIEVKGTLIAHIRGVPRRMQSDLTKDELDRMLEGGYPPWYRKRLKTRAGVEFDFPVRSVRDVYRGGWIVAVGLRSTEWEALAVYRTPGDRGDKEAFRHAIQRCRDIIETIIKPHFTNDRNVDAAIAALTYLVNTRTGSGIERLLQDCDFDRSWTYGMQQLTGGQCVFAMELMNRYEPLADGQVDELKAILLPVMDATVRGAYEVTQYLKDTGVELYIPQSLQQFDRPVYLRDCCTDIPL